VQNRELSEEFGADLSQLIDADLRTAIGDHKHIFLNSEVFSANRVKQASYELTLLDGRNLDFGPLDQCDERNVNSTHQERPAYNVTKNGDIKALVVNPWQSCLIRTREQIAMPDNVQGKVLARGQLFQKGLIVESTYIDPGFRSSEDRPGVHLMVFNTTQKAVTLPVGMPVARLELLRLAKVVSNPHGGAATIGQAEHAMAAWPWPQQLNSAAEETVDARRARDLGARLIAMDRQTHALDFLIKQVDDLKRSKDIQKLFMYWCIPWLVWLVLRVANIAQYLTGDALSTYKAVEVWVNWATFGLFALLLPTVSTIISKDARTAALRALRIKADT
jgi:deoxycytidine triphosphate deaminase